tara:strand:+ start:794 stop:922 length:129 start_codon:yes stop_codon:yes gene_type:complete
VLYNKKTYNTLLVGRTELQQIAALSLKKFLPGERAAINFFCN